MGDEKDIVAAATTVTAAATIVSGRCTRGCGHVRVIAAACDRRAESNRQPSVGRFFMKKEKKKFVFALPPRTRVAATHNDRQEKNAHRQCRPVGGTKIGTLLGDSGSDAARGSSSGRIARSFFRVVSATRLRSVQWAKDVRVPDRARFVTTAAACVLLRVSVGEYIFPHLVNLRRRRRRRRRRRGCRALDRV